jgi:outer membrane protein OmpA-like peptidoglycan-associated protein
MKKFLMISVLCAVTGCTSLPFMQPPAVTSPATPIFFQPFSTALDQPAISTIASVARAANEQPNTRIIVTGAADSVGDTQANIGLSKTRAQVVTDALVADGVAPDRIHQRAIGSTNAPAPAGTFAQSARRVLIQIVG